MRCPRCHAETRDGLKFCEDCGARLSLTCAQCGAEITSGKRFCGSCGAPVVGQTPDRFAAPEVYTPKHLAEKILNSRSAIEGERKQVTVLFCDLADSTALAERLGPEAMHGVLNRFFELALAEVHRYEGTINQFLGDGFMALFGAPVANEDHARRAALAALGIQRALGDRRGDLGLPENVMLAARIGVNTGPVVVGTIGDNLRMDYTAVGDTTNLAARLQQHAEPSQILISEVSGRLVKGYVRFEALAPFPVKGKAEPVTAFKVVGLGTRRSRVDAREDRALSAFVGRDSELALLRNRLAEVEAGRGQVVEIVGEPGVGKSRLLYEFRRGLEGRSVTYLEARCLSYGATMPYLPLQDIIRDNCGITDIDSPGEIGEKLRAALDQVGMNPEEGTHYLLHLLGVKEGIERLAQVGPETIKARIFDTLWQMSLNGSRRRPLILSVEDLHWIDKTSEEFFASAVEGLADAPILFLMSYRPRYKPPWIDKSCARQVVLRPLSLGDSRRVVESVVDRATALSESMAEFVISKAEGNPLFLEELTRAALEGGHQGASVTIPDTIHGVLAARIDRLPEEPKRALQTAAVLGREFSLRLLREVCQDARDLEGDLAELKRLEFLYERPVPEGAVSVFKHALTQDVAYESLLVARRQALHEAAGRAVESLHHERLEEQYEVLAHHYARSANAEKALEYLELANQKAAKANAMEAARAHFEAAMKILDGLPETEKKQPRRIALLVNQWLVMILLFKAQEYYDLLTRHETVAVKLGDPGLLGAFYSCLGWCEWWFGSFDQAIQIEAKAAELCEGSGNTVAAGMAYIWLQWSHLFKADYAQALALKEDILRTMKQGFNLRVSAWALAGASYAYSFLGRWEQAVEEGQEELRVGEEFSDNSVISFAAWNLSLACTFKGDLGRALEYAELGVQKAPTPADKAWAQGVLAWAWCRAGEPHKGVEILAQIVSMNRAARFAWGEIIFLLLLGDGYWLAGDYDNAGRTLEQCVKIAERCGTRFVIGSAHRLLGEVALRVNPAQVGQPFARQHFEQSIAILQEIKAENELALAYAGYGRLHKQLRDIALAREYLTKAQEIFDRLGTLIEPDKVRAELAELRSA